MNYIVDTSYLSQSPDDSNIGINIINNCKSLILTNHKFFTCESILHEIYNFISPSSVDELNLVKKLFIIDCVNMYSAKIPAILVAEMLTNYKSRNKSFLKSVETIIKEEAEASIKIGKVRRHNREKNSSGIIDSAADLELVFLARKKRGTLLTRDQGLTKIATQLGVRTSKELV